MANKKYVVKLSEKERQKLEELVKKGTHQARVLRRAHILLWAETKTDEEIAGLLKVTRRTVETIRQKWVEGGVEYAIQEGTRPGRPTKISTLEKAKITALACSDPPEGRSRWSLSLLADQAVTLELVPEVSRVTVQRILKKTK